MYFTIQHCYRFYCYLRSARRTGQSQRHLLRTAQSAASKQLLPSEEGKNHDARPNYLHMKPKVMPCCRAVLYSGHGKPERGAAEEKGREAFVLIFGKDSRWIIPVSTWDNMQTGGGGKGNGEGK